MKVRLLTPARLEFLGSVGFYESQAPRLGTDFIEEFEAALELIASNPRAGSPHMEGTRRVLMHRFPMDVVYVEEADSNLVVAVAHQRRKPGSLSDTHEKCGPDVRNAWSWMIAAELAPEMRASTEER